MREAALLLGLLAVWAGLRRTRPRGLSTLIVGWMLAAGLLSGAFVHCVGGFYYVDSNSMSPALIPADCLWVSRWGRPERGRIALCRWQNEVILKRVVALGGDHVSIRGGHVEVNGQDWGQATAPDQTHQVPADRYYVLGDNREHSLDSRAFGDVPAQDVLGTAVWRAWPPARIGFL